jgi:hypothetical protein
MIPAATSTLAMTTAPPETNASRIVGDRLGKGSGTGSTTAALIPKYIVDYYVAALDAQCSHVAVAVGLSDFTAYTCSKCGD